MNLPETDDYTFSDWLSSTALLQMEAYGKDPGLLVNNDITEFNDAEGNIFFAWNSFAMMAEVVEMADEVGWKPWATSRHINRERVIEEAVDAMHFLGNILRMVRCTGGELTEAYKAKQEKNLQRQQEGYDGRKNPPTEQEIPEWINQGSSKSPEK
jgi:hypothetical protein